jgi:hypothetical protein
MNRLEAFKQISEFVNYSENWERKMMDINSHGDLIFIHIDVKLDDIPKPLKISITTDLLRECAAALEESLIKSSVELI